MDCMEADLKMSEWQFPYDNWNRLEVVVVIWRVPGSNEVCFLRYVFKKSGSFVS